MKSRKYILIAFVAIIILVAVGTITLFVTRTIQIPSTDDTLAYESINDSDYPTSFSLISSETPTCYQGIYDNFARFDSTKWTTYAGNLSSVTAINGTAVLTAIPEANGIAKRGTGRLEATAILTGNYKISHILDLNGYSRDGWSTYKLLFTNSKKNTTGENSYGIVFTKSVNGRTGVFLESWKNNTKSIYKADGKKVDKEAQAATSLPDNVKNITVYLEKTGTQIIAKIEYNGTSKIIGTANNIESTFISRPSVNIYATDGSKSLTVKIDDFSINSCL